MNWIKPRERIRPEWEEVFVFWPKTIYGRNGAPDRTVWLEVVERRYVSIVEDPLGLGYFEYRLIGE